MRIISVSNQKGGVGKTTTTVNMATALAAIGKKVLVLDLDPQGNASTGFAIDTSLRQIGAYELLFGETTIAESAQPTKVPGLFVMPSSIHLSGAEIELISVENREFTLKNTLRSQAASYDYVIIDCPPSLNLLTLNALVASDSVLVPMQCEFFALEGLSHLMTTVQRVRDVYNPALEIEGIVLTMYDRRNSLSRQVANNVRDFFPDDVFDTVIPRNVRISEAPSHGLPAIVYDMHCAGSQAYIHLAKEVLKREELRKIKAQSLQQQARAVGE
jgi:chromosome partitioning protein